MTKRAYFKGVLIDVNHPVVHWENGEPVYVMPHTDIIYGNHEGGFIDRDENEKIKWEEADE